MTFGDGTSAGNLRQTPPLSEALGGSPALLDIEYAGIGVEDFRCCGSSPRENGSKP
jgi:hypothetical protein